MAKTITTNPAIKGNDKAQLLINIIDKWWDENRYAMTSADQTKIVNAVTIIIAN